MNKEYEVDVYYQTDEDDTGCSELFRFSLDHDLFEIIKKIYKDGSTETLMESFSWGSEGKVIPLLYEMNEEEYFQASLIWEHKEDIDLVLAVQQRLILEHGTGFRVKSLIKVQY